MRGRYFYRHRSYHHHHHLRTFPGQDATSPHLLVGELNRFVATCSGLGSVHARTSGSPREQAFQSSLSFPNYSSNPVTVETDYVIVGAGSAGSVLANRLTENPSHQVTILEAGPKDYSWKIHMPAALMYNLGGYGY